MADTPTRDQVSRLAEIRSFPQLVTYLRDELDWPISKDDFEDVDDLFYEFTPEELGIDSKNAAKIESIKRLRPLIAEQPWGIFFVKFEPRRLPVVALRRLLSAVALKERASANSVERQAWAADDLLFVSNHGEGEERRISFAHFTPGERATDLPTLKVLGWDGQDTALHLDQVATTLHRQLIWPEEGGDLEEWRSRWRSAFCLRHRETITTSKGLSIRLAQLARNIRDRIATVLAVESERGPLRKLLEAFQQALVSDLDEKGFADMYAQTIAYGLLSARIVDPKHRTTEDFAAHMRTSPFLRELMEGFITLGGRKRGEGGAGIDFDELGVAEVVELLDDPDTHIEEVVADFGRRKQGEDPVIHFYELFLAEYDKKEKVSRGVFYTPKPVVSYIVRSVDELLRTEFGLEDGLADTTTWGEMDQRHPDLQIPDGTSPDQGFVQILDPATGTGTFLVEVIEIVHATMIDKWKKEGVRSEKGLRERWNEYVPKHLLPRLHGYELMMAPYAIAHLKIGLKLYETGYHFESEERARVYLTNALEPAQDHSGKLSFSIPALAHEAEAVNEVKRHQKFTIVIANPPYSSISQNMDAYARELPSLYLIDDEGAINEKSNRNHLQDDYVKFIRKADLLLSRSGIGVLGYITNGSFLSGDWFRGMRYQLLRRFSNVQVVDLHGGVRENIKDDRNIFDIQQNVAISFMFDGLVSRDVKASRVVYRELIGDRESKYRRLLKCDLGSAEEIKPNKRDKWSFCPSRSTARDDWDAGQSLVDIFPRWGYGVKTNRDGLAVSFTRQEVMQKISDFISRDVPDDEIEGRYGFSSNYQWKTSSARERLRKEGLNERLILPYLFRPFDVRFIYWHPAVVFNMRGDKLLPFTGEDPSLGLLFSRSSKKRQPSNFFVTRSLVDCHSMEDANVAPLMLSSSLHSLAGVSRDNIDWRQVDSHIVDCDSRKILNYIYAQFHSTGYREYFSKELRVDRPKVFWTRNEFLLQTLCGLGNALIELHLLDPSALGEPTKSYFGPDGPEVQKVSYSDGTVWLNEVKTYGFKSVAEDVWNFQIGGYQVCDKWLKDRQAKGGKNPRPGRILTKEDIAHYQKIIVAISETIRIMGEIDEVIDQHGGWPDAFASS